MIDEWSNGSTSTKASQGGYGPKPLRVYLSGQNRGVRGRITRELRGRIQFSLHLQMVETTFVPSLRRYPSVVIPKFVSL